MHVFQERKGMSICCFLNSPFCAVPAIPAPSQTEHPTIEGEIKDYIMLSLLDTQHWAVSLCKILPLCHCSGSTGPNGPFHLQTRRVLDGLVTTSHHRRSLRCPQRSKEACCAVRTSCVRFEIICAHILGLKLALAKLAASWCVECVRDRTLVDHSFTVQSNEEVMKRWEKSIGPRALWQLMPVTGPWCPSNISPMPALLKGR